MCTFQSFKNFAANIEKFAHIYKIGQKFDWHFDSQVVETKFGQTKCFCYIKYMYIRKKNYSTTMKLFLHFYSCSSTVLDASTRECKLTGPK